MANLLDCMIHGRRVVGADNRAQLVHDLSLTHCADAPLDGPARGRLGGCGGRRTRLRWLPCRRSWLARLLNRLGLWRLRWTWWCWAVRHKRGPRGGLRLQRQRGVVSEARSGLLHLVVEYQAAAVVGEGRMGPATVSPPGSPRRPCVATRLCLGSALAQVEREWGSRPGPSVAWCKSGGRPVRPLDDERPLPL